MKKNTVEDKVVLQHAIEKRRKRELRKAKSNKGKRRKQELHYRQIFPGRYMVVVPKWLCLYQDEETTNATIEFLNTIEHLAVDLGRYIVLDFRTAERCTAAAVMCVYATIQSIQERLGDNKVFRCTLSGNSKVNSSIRFSGLLSLINGRAEEDIPFGYMPIVTGTTVKGHLRNIIQDMCNDFYDGDMSEDERFALYEAISEAMLNVINHAYMDGYGRDDFIKDRWWIIAARTEEQLYLAILDKGVGIPVSLPKNFDEQVLSTLRSIMGNRTDGQMIQAAMELGRTRTTHTGRGKGLQDVKGFVDINPNGKLWIFSNMGKYVYDNKTSAEKVSNIDMSIGGTLIQWNVSVETFKQNGERVNV